jgi:hypothetical protein
MFCDVTPSATSDTDDKDVHLSPIICADGSSVVLLVGPGLEQVCRRWINSSRNETSTSEAILGAASMGSRPIHPIPSV